MSPVSPPASEGLTPPSPPHKIVRAVQTSVYKFQDAYTPIKIICITSIALIGMGLLAVALLNHYQMIHTFSPVAEQSLLAVGVVLEAALLFFLTIYGSTTKYHLPADPELLDENYQFLTRRPEWYATKAAWGKGENLSKVSRYYDWFEFTSDKMGRKAGIVEIKMVDRPDVTVKWLNNRQFIYVENKEDPVYSVTFEKPPSRFHYPYLKENKLLILDFKETSPRIAVFDVDTKNSDKYFKVARNETVSLIRCCEDVLIIGYKSGLVQLINYNSGNLISSYKAKGEVFDAWVDEQKKTLVTFSPLSSIKGKRRLQEVWQF